MEGRASCSAQLSFSVLSGDQNFHPAADQIYQGRESTDARYVREVEPLSVLKHSIKSFISGSKFSLCEHETCLLVWLYPKLSPQIYRKSLKAQCAQQQLLCVCVRVCAWLLIFHLSPNVWFSSDCFLTYSVQLSTTAIRGFSTSTAFCPPPTHTWCKLHGRAKCAAHTSCVMAKKSESN